MSDDLPPLVDSNRYLATALPELIRTLAAGKLELAESKIALGKLTDACTGLAAELRRGRELPTAQTRVERPTPWRSAPAEALIRSDLRLY